MKIDPLQLGWMMAPQTIQVMGAPVARHGPDVSVHFAVGGSGRWRATNQKKECGHEN
jgi:hypothetical protein